MKTYTVYYELTFFAGVTRTDYIDIEADFEEDAIDKAASHLCKMYPSAINIEVTRVLCLYNVFDNI